MPDAAQVAQAMAVFLAASLAIAVPLGARLVRSWQLPILAGTVTAVTAWTVTLLLYCLGLALLS